MPKKKPPTYAARTHRELHPVDKEMQDKPKHSTSPIEVGRIHKNALGTRPHNYSKFKSKHPKGPRVRVNTHSALAFIGRKTKAKGGKSTKDVMGVIHNIKRKNTNQKVDVGGPFDEPGVKKSLKKNLEPTEHNFNTNPDLIKAKQQFNRMRTMQNISKHTGSKPNIPKGKKSKDKGYELVHGGTKTK